MGATYNPTLPTLKDNVRFVLGDKPNESGGMLLHDEEISKALESFGYNGAIAFLAGGLCAEHAQSPIKRSEAGQGSWDLSEMIPEWRRIQAQAKKGLYPEPGQSTTSRGVQSQQVVLDQTF